MTRRKLGKLALACCVVLAGCNDTSDLAPPSPTSPWAGTEAAPAVDHRPGAAQASNAAHFGIPSDPALPWHAGVGHEEVAGIDPARSYSLVELIDIAQRRNKKTRIAWEEARQAALNVGITRAAFLPEVTASALGGYQHIASPFPTNLVKQGYITANAEEIFPEIAIRYLLIDFGGGREATERAARQLSLAANVGFSAAHQQLIYTVARAYFTLDGVNAQMRAAQRALVNARALLQSAEALQGRGLGTVVATQSARRGAAQAVYQVAQANAAQHDATYGLLEALELPPTATLHVEDSSTRPLSARLLRTVDQMMQDALHQRPDLLADLARLRAADAGVERAQAEFAPKLSLQTNVQGNIGQISVDGGPYEGVQQPQAGLFLRFDWPIYQGGVRRNRLLQSESQRAAAEDALESATTSALRQVAQAYDLLQTGLQQYDAAVALEVASRSAYAAASDAFSHGIGTFNDAVNAGTALAAAEAAVANAHAQCLINSAGLAFATGELTSSDSASVSVPAPP